MNSGAPRRRLRNRKATLTVAVAIATAAAGASVASGDGGVSAPSPPTVKAVNCLERCLDVREVAETGVAELAGRDLGAVEAVRLAGEDGAIRVSPRRANDSRVEFKVPKGATSGKPLAIDEFGNRVRAPERLIVKPASSIEESSGFTVTRSKATPAKSFYDGKRRSQVEYLFEADGPTDIRIDVLKGKRRRLVDSMVKRDQQPYTNQRATWNGLDKHRKVAPSGKYKFQVTELSGGGGERSRFRYYDHRFPLAGRHDYGDGLGAGRGHQGQDVFAKCGNRIYAARGGRVQLKASHSSAGNYLVIDGRKTGVDYAYMHLEKKGRPKEGSKVRTGEVIGFNSDTGNASGCHLHFEMWSAPGWYEGGDPISPTKSLKRWDRWS